MTLRDIFITIGEIFDFNYEKNTNGSYRVNTVIKYLIYPELYADKAYSENEICHYLTNSDFSYQNIPNIRNSFSELMNNKKNRNRFPVIYFCEQINIQSLYSYYNNLISSLNEQKRNSLSNFLKKIFDSEPTFFAHLRLICSKDYELLSWIIVYSMFNKELADKKYENFSKNKKIDISDLSISESSERHKLSSFLYHKKAKLTTFTVLTFILSVLQIFFALIPYIMQNTNVMSNARNNSIFCIALLLFSLVELLIRRKQSKLELSFSDLQTYHSFMDEMPDASLSEMITSDINSFKIQSFNNQSNCNTSRDRLRNSLKTIIYIVLALSILLSFALNSFPILIALVFLFIIIVMFVDKHFHDALTRLVYDKNTSKEGAPINQWKGLAKIYRWEYKITKFEKKHEYYKNIMHVHSASCYKHIFLIAHERLRYNLYIYTIVLVYFNLLFILVVSLNLFLGDPVIKYMRFKDITTLNLLVTLFILAVGIYTITTLITSRANYSNLSFLAYASTHAKSNPSWSEKTFLSLYARGIIKDTDWMRGIFTYNVSLFEKGNTIENIHPETDRMLFYHRQFIFRNNAIITISLLYCILLTVFVWHFEMYKLVLPITIGCIFIYVYLYKYGLNKINKKRIIKKINELFDE